MQVNLTNYQSVLSTRNRFARLLWNICCVIFFRPTPPVGSIFRRWRRFVLSIFGAKLHVTANVYPSVKIWAPWNLKMGAYSALATNVNVYNTGMIDIGEQVTISQGAYLCPGSHDISNPKFPMICSAMTIEDSVWIATEAFVGGRNVTVGEGAVVAARAVVMQSVEPWTVVGGNPAKFIKKRVLRSE